MMHLWLLVRYRTWYFSTILVGTFMEIVGYIFRLLSSQQDPYSVIWFVVQYFLIVVAPVMFSAAIYITVSKMIQVYGETYAPLPPKLIIWIFVICDVVSTIVQVAGAALVGVAYSDQKDPTTYNHILLAGLAFQVASFAIYLFILATTLYKARNSTKSIDRGFVLALLVATLAVYLRTCFRLAETAEGLMAMLSTHEVYFACLEFAPIVIAVFLFTWWHPGRWLHESRDRTSHGEVEMARG
ncbi:RTA1 like protein [Aureobasidium sp. EXF-3400]|nr:RTA1 like protein [Aureobasidium sp. EXF-12344]KAI4777352.1 RTA1 like protein [Aureobasidium sp. EXF-3400]